MIDDSDSLPPVNMVPFRSCPKPDLAIYRDMSFEEFIGADHDTLLVRDSFACSLAQVVRWQLDNDLVIHQSLPVTPPLAMPALRFVAANEFDLLLVEPHSGLIFGGYIAGNLAIEPSLRGRGLGAETLVEFTLRGGPHQAESSFGNLEFSPAGIANRRKALTLLQDDAYCERKWRQLQEARAEMLKIDFRHYGGDLLRIGPTAILSPPEVAYAAGELSADPVP